MKLARPALAKADFAAARQSFAGNAGMLNNLCYAKATNDVALDQALDECDDALKILPRAAGVIDSRALVLLRIGRTADAIAAYDAAIAIDPRQAHALYGRGLARRRSADEAGGASDIAAAKAILPDVEKEFTSYGVTR